MKITVDTICRGNGRGYLELVFEGVSENYLSQIRAVYEAESSQLTIPCGVYPSNPGADMWREKNQIHAVVVFPLLDGTDCTIRLFNTVKADIAIWERRFSPKSLKVISRLTYSLHSRKAHAIRDIDAWRTTDCRHASILGVYRTRQDKVAIRVHALFPYIEKATYTAYVYDYCGKVMSKRVECLESSVIPGKYDRAQQFRSLSYSILTDSLHDAVCIVIQRDGDTTDAVFVCLLPGMIREFLDKSRAELEHASLDSQYDDWFRRHRSTLMDLRAQRVRVQEWKERPLISIICVVFRTPVEYLHDLMSSILSQSYDRFELILVNVSGDYPSVSETLLRYSDDRIRVMTAENRSIADNTNIGIQAACGEYIAFVDHDDVIEPDTLYRYAMMIKEHPQTDLLYCDEDKLIDGKYEWPVFKPAFNRDLLYSYNYVTHMLMISRTVLNQIELSPADVSGAQDYDLTLKCTEKAREIRNVPYVLYHWREHPGSTSANADSKPYADEAGRLALQRHVDRRGVEASVEKGPGMFRYRIRYRSADEPRVSIIIPTKDHVQLLSACIESVLDKTTYRNFEIIAVENNSIEPETFEYYEHIEEQYEQVHVVRWPGRGFNYSAICNFGARCACGEILLFLNNDTEVLEPNWLTSMVGFMYRPEVGVVGAKLLYRDGLVQHGGVWVSPGGCDYINQRCNADDLGYMETLANPFDCAAITGACQMIKRSIFDRIGGFDEQLDVVLNDIDLCLRSNDAGFVTVFDSDAVLYHNEFSSRGHDEQDPEKEQRAVGEQMTFFNRWSKTLLADRGKFININLDQYNGHFKIVR